MFKSDLQNLYIDKKLSVAEISYELKFSQSKINYWLRKYSIPKRSISDAVYTKINPAGDPFYVVYPRNTQEGILYGMGLGLFMGEGNKKNKYSVRLGNVDPKIILTFINFLEKFYSIKKDKLRFGIQIFSDCKPKDSLEFWKKKLGVDMTQFYKVIVTPSRGAGTYTEKNLHGVLTVYFNNKKLRNILSGVIENF